jgi:lysozyme
MALTEEQLLILKNRLSRTEGRRSRPYVDTVGKITIGIGHNLTDRGLSEQTIDAIFAEDIAQAQIDAVKVPVYLELDPIRQTVLIDMIFNMGLDKFLEFHKFIGHLSRRDYNGAADEMLLSTWARQVGYRAVELASIIRSGSIGS